VLFTNGFCSAPSCAPSRATVLTSRNFWELEQGALIQAYLPSKFQTFTELLIQSGYQTGSTGKTLSPYASPMNVDYVSTTEVLGPAYSSVRIADPPDEVSSIDYANNFDVFLSARDPEKPFFFWAGTLEPHGPYGAQNYLRLESEFGVALNDVQVLPWQSDTTANRKARGNFLYEICLTDQHLGRMLTSLETAGELDNTLVIVVGDNGTANRGKASHYDFGVHEPLAVMWHSRAPAGRTVTDFVNFADFGPTILDAAGISVPGSMTGRSFLSVLESDQSGRIDPERNFIMTGLEWHGEFDPVSNSSRSIRDDQYSYSVLYDNVAANGDPLSNEELTVPASENLYDLVNDPYQLNNLANNASYATEKQRLADLMRQYGLQTGDPRFTGEMDIFRVTRQYVQDRKRLGYTGAALSLAYPLYLLPGPAQVTLDPLVDAFVQGGTYADTNKGSVVVLSCKTDPVNEGFTRRPYLRFDLSSVKARILSATLRLKVASTNGSGDMITAHVVAENGWDEMAITWNNAPAPGDALASALQPANAGEWLDLDVTGQVMIELTGDSLFSVVLVSSGTVLMGYHSREAPKEDRPQLVIQTISGEAARAGAWSIDLD